jgi:HK97 family phage major capsid protein
MLDASAVALGRAFSSPGIVFMAAPSVESLSSRRDALVAEFDAIEAAANEDDRDYTEEEARRMPDLINEINRLADRIQLRRQADNLQRTESPPPGANRRTTEDGGSRQPGNGGNLTNGRPSVPAQPRSGPPGMWGWRNGGEFALAVRNAALGGQPDNRLRGSIENAAASTYSQEAVGADGGYAVPPDIRADIVQRVMGEGSLMSLTDTIPTSSNSVTIPVDNTTPWQTTGGIQAYWVSEAQTKTQSKPALEQVTVRANTLACLVPITEELLEDAPALDAYIRRKAPEKMDFVVSNAIVRGDGIGKPFGFLNSGSLLTVAAEGAQTADTIVAANIAKMYAAMPVASQRTAVWLIHPTATAFLPLLVIGTQPVWLPPSGLQANIGNGTLLGRPVMVSQTTDIIGNVGDIIFVDLAQYMTLIKTGQGRDANSLRTDVSIHLWFDQDLVAFRFTMRVGGQPWWNAPVTGRDGASTLSPFIVLAAR